MVPFLAVSSPRPGSALWEKREISALAKKEKNRRANGKGCAAQGAQPFPPPQDTAQLASLADIFSI